jgi:hypothetical protein
MRYTRFIDMALCFLRNRKGVSCVEFVLILPVLVVCLFGTIEIGRVLHDYHVVVKSVRDGTRFLTRFPVECTTINVDGIFVDDQGNPDNTNKTYGENLTKRGSIDPDADYLVGAWSNTGSQLITRVECNPRGTLEGLYAGTEPEDLIVPSIYMEAVVKFDFLGSLPLLPDTIDFTVSHKEIWIGE